MINIVIPMAGSSAFFPAAEDRYPKIFQEIHGRPMIQAVLENLNTINLKKRFIFIINDEDATRYRLDNILKMLTEENCEIVLQKSATKGAVCSILLAVEHINNDEPLLIANADQIIDHDLNKTLAFLSDPDIDGGVVYFDSIHPQWSYARITDHDKLVETAEKEPISRNAIAGLYYFQRGQDFVKSAMKSIVKDRSHNGVYYTSLVLNEMILDNRNLLTYKIDSSKYHSFYSPEKIKEYEQETRDQHHD
jgi:dTDP-glucose pyrophosphorylase